MSTPDKLFCKTLQVRFCIHIYKYSFAKIVNIQIFSDTRIQRVVINSCTYKHIRKFENIVTFGLIVLFVYKREYFNIQI